jgi:ABC-type phosphate transport system permease subunit
MTEPEQSPQQPSLKKSQSKALVIAAQIVGAVIGYVVVRALPFEMTLHLLGGAVAGTLIGLIPFFIAKKRDRKKLGQIALISCTVSGLALGLLLALPVAVIFSLVIHYDKNP